jgi:hypothetical protein
MNKFDTLLEAAEYAVTRCNSWSFTASDEKYDVKNLLVIAEVSDSEDPIDEDCFYVVTPSGAIGYCDYGEDIDWLFLSDAAPNEDLPLTYQAAPQKMFCTECGASVIPGARFCGECGNML